MEQVLAQLLVEHGLSVAFGVTGSGPSLRFISALENLGATYYPASHEAAAAIMAGAAQRASGKWTASISIKGPGIANMLPGIAFNAFENIPTLSLAEEYSRDAPARKHKRIDQIALLRPVCKGCMAMDQAPTHLDSLLRCATTEVPGPVHIDLTQHVGNRIQWSNAVPAEAGSDQRTHCLRLIEKSRRPLLVVGSLALRRSWGNFLRSVQIPTFTTAGAKGLIDERSPWSLGVFTGDGKGKALAPESYMFKMCDLVVGLALRNLEVISPHPLGKPFVVIDEVQGDLRDGFQPDLVWATKAMDDFVQVLNVVTQRSWGKDLCEAAKAKINEALPPDRWLPAACFHYLNKLKFDYTAVFDTGSFCTVGEHVWVANPRRRFLGSSNGRYMGGSIPTAIGASVANPDQPLFCFIGDGGMRMYPAEIRIAVAECLPICFVLMMDGRFGSIASTVLKQKVSPRAFCVLGSSWASVVEGMGCPAIIARAPEDFAEAIDAWNMRVPQYIECQFRPDEYEKMTGNLR